jgi:2-dehydropantoate 2-reductase
VRFVSYGAGAIGGTVGARLYQAGRDIALIARGAHGAAICSDGLVVETGDSRVTLPIPCYERPEDVQFGPDDVVLLAVKSEQTAAALDALAAAAPPTTTIVCLQNGVSNELTALRIFESVYGCFVYLSAAHLRPGVISAPARGTLDVGRFPAGVDRMATDTADAFRAAGFDSVARPDVMRWKYTKLLMNLDNVVQALCGPEAAAPAIHDELQAEARACFAAAGIELVGTDELRERGISRRPRGVPKRSYGNSSWQSLSRATGSLETDYLNGEIVLLGRLYRVPTPANLAITELARMAARERRAPGSFTEADLMAAIEAAHRRAPEISGIEAE